MAEPGDKRDFLSLYEFSADEFRGVLARAIELKAIRLRGEGAASMAGKVLGMVFEKASTRTRVSFEVGMFELGGHAVYLSTAGSQIGRGEPICDTARVLSGYCQAILIRTFGHERIEELAKWSSVPVINGLTDLYHPCQIVADLQTVMERKGGIEGFRYAWIGDGNNMAHSWINAAAILGLDLVLACPEGYEPAAAVMAEAERRIEASGSGSITLVRDPRDAAKGSRVISTDVWASMGQEEENNVRRKAFNGYCVSQELLSHADKDAMVLHCLPAHRGEEISAEVLEGPQSAVFQQAENRLHAQKAILEAIVQ